MVRCRRCSLPGRALLAQLRARGDADAVLDRLLVGHSAALRVVVGPQGRDVAASCRRRARRDRDRPRRRRAELLAGRCARGRLGVGVAAYHPEGSKFAAFVSGNRRASGMALFSIGGNIGYALGPLVATPIVLAFGLRGGLLLAVPCWRSPRLLLVVSRYLGGFVPSAAARARAAGQDRWRPMSLLLGAVAFRSVTWFGLITFVPLWEVSLGHSKAYGNHLLSLMLITGGIGTLILGPMADRFGRRPILALSSIADGAARPRLRRRRRGPRRGRARSHRRLRDGDVRRDDGDGTGVPAAPRRAGLGARHRALDRARRDRSRRARRARRHGRPPQRALRCAASPLVALALTLLLPAGRERTGIEPEFVVS